MTSQELRDYIRRKLGAPVNHIEITTEQLDDCIEESTEKFVEQHYDGIDIDYFFLPMVVGQNIYTLDDDIESILDIQGSTSSVFGDDPILMKPFYLGMGDVSGIDVYDATQIEFYRQRMKIIKNQFDVDIMFDYNTTLRKLTLAVAPTTTESIAIKFYRSATTNNVENVYKNLWLKKYAVALAREQWGVNLGKFGNVTLPGGITFKGDEILSMGREDKEALEIELEERYSEPPDPLVG